MFRFTKYQRLDFMNVENVPHNKLSKLFVAQNRLNWQSDIHLCTFMRDAMQHTKWKDASVWVVAVIVAVAETFVAVIVSNGYNFAVTRVVCFAERKYIKYNTLLTR